MANSVISVNFEGVESGGGFVRIPEGDYIFEVTKVSQKTGESSNKPYLLFSLKAVEGPKRGLNKTVAHVCSLGKNALWNLRNLLEAAGKTIPSKAIKIDLDKLAKLRVGGTAVDDEFEGKKKSSISNFFPVSEFVLSDEETPVKKDGKDLEDTPEEDDETTPEDENSEDEELI